MVGTIYIADQICGSVFFRYLHYKTSSCPGILLPDPDCRGGGCGRVTRTPVPAGSRSYALRSWHRRTADVPNVRLTTANGGISTGNLNYLGGAELFDVSASITPSPPSLGSASLLPITACTSYPFLLLTIIVNLPSVNEQLYWVSLIYEIFRWFWSYIWGKPLFRIFLIPKDKLYFIHFINGHISRCSSICEPRLWRRVNYKLGNIFLPVNLTKKLHLTLF